MSGCCQLRSSPIKACLVALVLFMPLAVSPVPFVQGALDTTMDNEDSPIIFLCGEDFGEVMTVLEFERLVDEGIITIGDLPLRSMASDIGEKSLGEA